MSTTSILISLFVLIKSAISQQSAYYPDSTICEYGAPTDNYVTYCDLNNTLRAEILERFEVFTTFIDLIPKMIRLIFHDCFGPQEGDQTIAACDGCLDYSNADHAGLVAGAVDRIESIFTKGEGRGGYNWDLRMSRADYWAAVATIVLQESTWLNGSTSFRNIPESMQYPNDEIPYLPFYIGRKDCSGSPETAVDTTKEFPHAILGWTRNFNLFNDPISGFDTSEREYIALMGAHGLGRVNSLNSGFGTSMGIPWVEDWDTVGNSYYNLLLDDGTRTTRLSNWEQKVRQLNDSLYEWVGPRGTERFRMLNSDIALLLDVDDKIDTATGEITDCTFETCPRNTAREAIITEFANDNQLWLNEFAAVFDKMIKTGYDRSINPSDLKVLAEDWYYTANNVTVPSLIPECESIVQYTSDMDPTGHAAGTYGRFGRVRNRQINTALQSTIAAFVADTAYDHCSKNTDYLAYYYGYTHNANGNNMIFMDTQICCGVEGAVFPETYTAPAGYSYVGTGAAFTDGDITGSDDIVKNVIVWCLVGLVICAFCITAGVLFVRYKGQRKLQSEVAGIETANETANEAPITTTNDEL